MQQAQQLDLIYSGLVHVDLRDMQLTCIAVCQACLTVQDKPFIHCTCAHVSRVCERQLAGWQNDA